MQYFSKRRKGQNLVLEEILFVGLGVFVLAGLSITFNSLNNHVSDDFEDQNILQISNFVLSAVDRLVFANATEGYIVLKIPDKISRDNYIISGFNPPRNQFMIKVGDNNKVVDAPVDIRGIVSSSNKILKVEYNGTSIFLRGDLY